MVVAVTFLPNLRSDVLLLELLTLLAAQAFVAASRMTIAPMRMADFMFSLLVNPCLETLGREHTPALVAPGCQRGPPAGYDRRESRWTSRGGNHDDRGRGRRPSCR